MAQAMNRRRNAKQIAIEQFPHLKEHIEAWPDLANSLIPTGRINELKVSNGAYIDTGISFGPDNAADFRFCITGTYAFTPYVWNLHGSTSGRTACCIGFSPSRYLTIGNGSEIVELRHYPELIGQVHTYDMRFSPDGSKITLGVGIPGTDGYSYVHAIAAAQSGTRTNLHIFHCNGLGSVFEGSVREVIVGQTSDTHRLVPYIQDGHCGLLDLTDLTFHYNAAVTGIVSVLNLPAVE